MSDTGAMWGPLWAVECTTADCPCHPDIVATALAAPPPNTKKGIDDL